MPSKRDASKRPPACEKAAARSRPGRGSPRCARSEWQPPLRRSKPGSRSYGGAACLTPRTRRRRLVNRPPRPIRGRCFAAEATSCSWCSERSSGCRSPRSPTSSSTRCRRHRSTSTRRCPGDIGFDSVPWWWPLPLLVIGGFLVALAIQRLPGNGGHTPADGFEAGTTLPIELPGILVAAFVTLSCGAVLGPEAPLIAIGSGLGVLDRCDVGHLHRARPRRDRPTLRRAHALREKGARIVEATLRADSARSNPSPLAAPRTERRGASHAFPLSRPFHC